MWYRDLYLTRAAAVGAGVLFLLPGCQPSAALVGSTARIAARAAEEASGGGFGSRKAAAEASRAEKPDKAELRDVNQVLKEAYAGAETPSPAKWTPLKQLTPVQSGEGVIVFEPVSRGADAATAEVAAGGANWLQLAVGGQLDLGKTPLLTTIGRVRAQMGKKDLRLEPAEAAKLAALTGATRAVTGEVSGSGTRCTVTLQIYSVPDGKPVGPPIRLECPIADLPGKLPDAAQRLAVALGVTSPQASVAPQLKAEDLALLNRLMYRSPNAQEVAQLQVLSPRDPLAALLLVDSGQAKSPAAALKSLMAQAGKNPLVLGHIGYIAASDLALYREPISAEFKQHPHNYALAHTNVWLNRVLHRPNSERTAAEAVVRDAPRNPDAWLSLGWTASDVADTVRRGRVADALGSGEEAIIGRMYAEWLQAVYRATQLDPQYGRAWDRVARAATFAGEGKLATDAFWKADQYSPDKESLYKWGLEMFQPKWLDDAANLNRVADLTVKAQYPTYRDTLDMAKELVNAGLKPQADTLRQRVMDQARAAIKKNPNDRDAHYYLSSALWENGQLPEAAAELEPLARAHPDDVEVVMDTGQLMVRLHRNPAAIRYYQDAVRLQPGNAGAHASLGWLLKGSGKTDEAEKELREAIKLNPETGMPYSALAEIAASRHQYADALRYYEISARLQPAAETEFAMEMMLRDQKKYAEAEVHARRGLGMYPDYPHGLGELGYLLATQHKSAEAVKVCQVALQRDPNDVITQENLGEALYDSGRKKEGLEQLRRVLTMGDERAAAGAREFLAKHPQ